MSFIQFMISKKRFLVFSFFLIFAFFCNVYLPENDVTKQHQVFGKPSTILDKVVINTYSQIDNYTIKISLPPLSFIYFGQDVTISGNVIPNLSGIEIQFRIKSDEDDDFQDIDESVITSDDGDFTFDFNPAGYRYVEIQAFFYDNEGNEISDKLKIEVFLSNIISGVSIGSSIIAVILITAHNLTNSLGQAAKVFRNINKSIKKGDCKKISKNLQKIEKHISKAVAKGKLPSEILSPPYSLIDNLCQIRVVLSKAIESGNLKTLPRTKELEPYLECENITEFLKTSEINAYLAGVGYIIENYRKINKFKPLKDSEQVSNSKYCIPFISKFLFVKPFSDVMYVEGSTERDFWFRWKGDIEPVKIIYDKKKTRSLYRFHWKHFYIKPYLDNKNRIQIFFPPHFHTPIIRSKIGILFDVFVSSFNAEVYDTYKLKSKAMASWFRRYYASKGLKDEHPPAVEYNGWLHADRINS